MAPPAHSTAATRSPNDSTPGDQSTRLLGDVPNSVVEVTSKEFETGDTDRFWNVPNSISMVRLGLALFTCALIAAGRFPAAFVVFLVASGTDWLDGYLARRLDQMTAIGRQLDPLVDKVLILGCLIFLLPVAGSGVTPWIVAPMILRELLIQDLRSRLEGRGIAFGARWSGKLKTAVQIVAVALALICLTWEEPGPLWADWAIVAREVGLIAAVVLTLLSGLQYLVAAWPHLRRSL